MVYSESPARLGQLAPQAIRAAQSGDVVALRLVEHATGYLVEIAIAAAADEEPDVIVMGGSVLNRARPISERVRAGLAERWPQARFEGSTSGESGAVAVALRDAGVDVTPTLLARLRTGAG